jgi:hypothetical protein
MDILVNVRHPLSFVKDVFYEEFSAELRLRHEVL